MQFDKLIFHRADRSGSPVRVTVDFGIGEITAQAAPGGEVMWCRLSGYRGTVLRMKLDACDFSKVEDSRAVQDGDAPEAGGLAVASLPAPPPSDTGSRKVSAGRTELEAPPEGWSLGLCSEGKPVRHLSGNGNPTEQSNAFASLIDLCLSFAENRSVGQRVPLSPEPAF